VGPSWKVQLMGTSKIRFNPCGACCTEISGKILFNCAHLYDVLVENIEAKPDGATLTGTYIPLINPPPNQPPTDFRQLDGPKGGGGSSFLAGSPITVYNDKLFIFQCFKNASGVGNHVLTKQDYITDLNPVATNINFPFVPPDARLSEKIYGSFDNTAKKVLFLSTSISSGGLVPNQHRVAVIDPDDPSQYTIHPLTELAEKGDIVLPLTVSFVAHRAFPNFNINQFPFQDVFNTPTHNVTVELVDISEPTIISFPVTPSQQVSPYAVASKVAGTTTFYPKRMKFTTLPTLPTFNVIGYTRLFGSNVSHNDAYVNEVHTPWPGTLLDEDKDLFWPTFANPKQIKVRISGLPSVPLVDINSNPGIAINLSVQFDGSNSATWTAGPVTGGNGTYERIFTFNPAFQKYAINSVYAGGIAEVGASSIVIPCTYHWPTGTGIANSGVSSLPMLKIFFDDTYNYLQTIKINTEHIPNQENRLAYGIEYIDGKLWWFCGKGLLKMEVLSETPERWWNYTGGWTNQYNYQRLGVRF